MDHGLGSRGRGLDKFHVEIFHLDGARSARLKEGSAASLAGYVRSVRRQQLSQVLQVVEANPGEEANCLDASEDELRAEALKEGMISSHTNVVTEKTFAADPEGQGSSLGEEICDLFVGAVEGLGPGRVVPAVGKEDFRGFLDADENLSQLSEKARISGRISAFLPHNPALSASLRPATPHWQLDSIYSKMRTNVKPAGRKKGRI